jgi:hypothetical protein
MTQKISAHFHEMTLLFSVERAIVLPLLCAFVKVASPIRCIISGARTVDQCHAFTGRQRFTLGPTLESLQERGSLRLNGTAVLTFFDGDAVSHKKYQPCQCPSDDHWDIAPNLIRRYRGLSRDVQLKHAGATHKMATIFI